MSEVEYELQPFESVFLARREEITRLVAVSSHAMKAMSGSAHLSEVLKHPASRVEFVRKMEDAAALEAAADFPLLHGAATVLLWGALEAAIRDFLVRWLHTNPKALQIDELRKVRISVWEYEALVGEDRARYLLGILEREWAAALKPGIGRFECLLRPFGLSPEKTDGISRDLNEMAAIRNVIVHRASIADRRLIELCPWLGFEDGATVTVGRDAFHRYVRAASEYSVGIIERVRGSKLKVEEATKPDAGPTSEQE